MLNFILWIFYLNFYAFGFWKKGELGKGSPKNWGLGQLALSSILTLCFQEKNALTCGDIWSKQSELNAVQWQVAPGLHPL